MRAKKNRLCLLLCALSLHTTASANDALLSEDDFLGDLPTVLTVSRLAQPKEDAPSAVTVIDQETIRAAGIIDLADVFRLVPGMYVAHNAGFFHTVNPTVSYHGLTDAYARQMQVLIDGRTVYQPMYGGVQWSDLPLTLDDIARIEVTRGPNAASHGANAFLGVINIITLHASETTGSRATLTAGATRGEVLLRHGAKRGDLHYRVSVGYRKDDGLPARDDDKHIHLLNLRADYQLNARDELEFQFGYNGGTRQEGMLDVDPVLFRPRTKDVTSHFESLRWRRSLDHHAEIQLQAYHSRDKSEDHVVSANLEDLFPVPLLAPRIQFNNNVTTERYDIEGQHTFAPTPTTRAVWGAGLRMDQTHAPILLGTSDTERFYLGRLFGHAEWRPVDQLLFNAGAMLERNNLTGTDLSPRFSANFSPVRGHTVRLGISTATRTPTLLEEKFNVRALVPTQDPDLTFLAQQFLDVGGLEPERIVSREIGYLGQFGMLSIDARMFHDQIRDLMRQYTFRPFPVPDGMVATSDKTIGYRNGGELSIRGFEVQAELRWASHTRLLANYAHVRIGPDMDSTTFASNGDRLRFKDFGAAMPRDSFSMLAWHKFGRGWTGSLSYYQTHETNMPADGDFVRIARHTDARLARQFDLGNHQLELALIAQNLFDQGYHEFASYNTSERRSFLQLRMDF